eukprot:TRINITY_DN22855_c0_g1_i1.p1 TRINITY_DN22855_c0_g1~~TRINITY_DN22855_c0_g1_i1.p1  ORF type:complete len:227 (-),score=27.73 TRINITY_DN22855_c0_g1_i1:227-907(-)
MASEYTLTWTLLVSIVVTISVFSLLVYFWGSFLDRHEHDPGRVRAVMFIGLSVLTLSELSLAASGAATWEAFALSLLVNLWGGMDAVLRFPASHDLESWFSAKQFVLLIVKTVGYAFGLVSFRQNVSRFIAILLLNIWGLPVLYLMALPLDPMGQVADDAYDIDLALRVWQLAMCSKERRRCMDTCRCWMNRKLVAASEQSSLARMAICAASPQYRKAFSKKGRSI